MTEVDDLFAQSAALRKECRTLIQKFQKVTGENGASRGKTFDILPASTFPEIRVGQAINAFYQRLERTIRTAQERLADNEELEVTYAGPADEIITVLAIGCQGDDLILLYGEDEDDTPTTIMLQFHQVSLVMKTVKIPYKLERRWIRFRGDAVLTSPVPDPWQLRRPLAANAPKSDQAVNGPTSWK